MFTDGLYYLAFTLLNISSGIGSCPFHFSISEKQFYCTKYSKLFSFPFTCIVFLNNIFCTFRTIQAKYQDVSVIQFSWSYLVSLCTIIPVIVCIITSLRTVEYTQVLNTTLTYFKNIESKKCLCFF